MAWKTLLLDELLYKPVRDRKITAITLPYNRKHELIVGVGEEINLIFKKGNETKILECKVKSMNIVKYKHLTDDMAQDAGFKTGDLLRYNLKETFPAFTGDGDYYLYMGFVYYNDVSEDVKLDTSELKRLIIDGLNDMSKLDNVE